MGNTSTSTDLGETEDSKRWFFENILFFDPASDEDRETWVDERVVGGPRVKRFTPSNAILCNRNFLIHLTFNGKPKDYILKLQNQPLCRMLLCDKRGELIKEIRTNRLKHIQRQGMIVEVFVRRDKQELSSFTFAFDSITECDLFCEFVKMLFGIQVYHVGASPLEHFIPATELIRHHAAPEDDTSSSDEEFSGRRPTRSARNSKPQKKEQKNYQAPKPRTGCPVHGNKPCRCNVERPVLSKQSEENTSEDTDEVEAARTDKFPIVIEGACETGASLKLKDVAVRQLNKPLPRVIEWFRSQLPGKDSSFPHIPIKTGASYRLKEEDVGHYIQLRVLRRLEEAEQNPFVYSLAVKGPVTVNSESAKGMLQYLSVNEATVEALVDNQSLHDLFELPPNTLPAVRPFFQLGVTLLRNGLRFESKAHSVNQPLTRELQTSFFYVMRPASEDVDVREDNLELHLHILASSIRLRRCVEKTISLRMSSEAARDHFFHTLRLRRLIAKMPSFERWARDLETGNFTNIKQYYARAWEECTWDQYTNFKKAEQMIVAEWNRTAVEMSEAVATYASGSQATGLHAAAPKYAPVCAAAGVQYSDGMTQPLSKGVAPPATNAHPPAQVLAGGVPRYATSAGAGVAVSKAKAVAGTQLHPAGVAGAPPVKSARPSNAPTQHAVIAPAGTQKAWVSASPGVYASGGPAAAIVGGEGVGGIPGTYTGKPPPKATAAPATPAKAPASASPVPMTQGRINNYAIYAELYRSMNITGAGQNAATSGNTARNPAAASAKNPQATGQPKAKAQAALPAKAPATQVAAQPHPKAAAPAAVTKAKAPPKAGAAPAATAQS